MTNIFKIIAILAYAVYSISNSNAQNVREINIESTTCVHLVAFNDKCTPVSIKGKLFNPHKPTDAVVVIVHGSQGVDERHFNYAKHLNSIGFAALVLDSWTARGIGMAHFDFAANEKKGARAYNLAIDVFRTVEVLRKQPEGFKRFGHIGESMGGGAAIWLTKPYLHSEYLKLFSVKPPELQANIAVYGGCFERVASDRFIPIPTLFLGGELDNDTPAIYCEKFAEWMNSRGGAASSIILKGQHHDFDAIYKLHTASRAENPSECASYIEGNFRTWEKTGEKFPMTAEGYRNFQRKCVRSAWMAPVKTGYIDSPFTGFKEWGEFFSKILGNP
jgi:dienelactone hydrolase